MQAPKNSDFAARGNKLLLEHSNCQPCPSQEELFQKFSSEIHVFSLGNYTVYLYFSYNLSKLMETYFASVVHYRTSYKPLPCNQSYFKPAYTTMPCPIGTTYPKPAFLPCQKKLHKFLVFMHVSFGRLQYSDVSGKLSFLTAMKDNPFKKPLL